MRENIIISKHAKIGHNVTICDGVIIEDGVEIGDNTYIDYGTIIRANVKIGANVYIGVRCILGELLMDEIMGEKKQEYITIIGNDSIIRSETIIYGDCLFGSHFQTGHRVTIREKTKVGDHVSIGTLSDVQGDCVIGDYVRMHSNVHIGMKSVIEDFVWIFPYCVLTNDPTPPSTVLNGVTIKKYAVVSTGSVILPGVTIDSDTLVAAHANVTKDVYKGEVVGGNPAKVIGNIENIRNKETDERVYPWRESFDRGMPWEKIGYDKWKQSDNKYL